jgi:sRNA-binding carbon storage regulator CsrA
MLVLSRSEDQSAVIQCPNGDTIEIVHCGKRGTQTKFGFIAPDDYKILRSELVEQRGTDETL